MEYLEGEELRMYLQREKLCRPERMVRVLSQLAIGLKQPHELKLVHRDIKPDNIFLCGAEGGPIVKLLDFGSVRDNSEGAKKLTVVGTTIGSPFYMSPEQAQGLPDLDHRADVWSLAAITYEVLTGKVPFYGASGPQILLAILGNEPAPPSIVTNAVGFAGARLPEAVDDVLTDALTKDHHIRIGSVAELADRFGRAFGLEGTHTDWAYRDERELRRGVRAALEAAMAPPAPVAPAPEANVVASRESPPPAAATAFRDDEFVMGVPSGSSKGLYLGIAAAVLLVVVVVLVVLLA
jgi:serine/threonine-protein kinase